MSSATKQKILLKLLKKCGHASADRLQRLRKSAGNKETECYDILQKTDTVKLHRNVVWL